VLHREPTGALARLANPGAHLPGLTANRYEFSERVYEFLDDLSEYCGLWDAMWLLIEDQQAGRQRATKGKERGKWSVLGSAIRCFGRLPYVRPA
jgi:hypothetical protein